MATGGLLWAAGALLLLAVGPARSLGPAAMAVLCLGGLASMAGGVLIVVLSLRSLAQLPRRLEPVRTGQVERLGGTFPSEVQPLVDDLNALLERNREALQRTRVEADELAHALKTPLAILANAVDRMARDGNVTTPELARQIELLQSTIDLHLTRTRATASQGARPEGCRCEVDPVVRRVVRAVEKLHRARQMEFQVDIEPGVTFAGDPEDLEEMLGNLLDNAGKWARHRVRITARAEGGRLRLEVEDDGNGLGEVRAETLLERGARGDARGPGTGVGLAIVRTLAELYEGRIDLGQSPLGGVRAVLALPTATPPG